MPERQASNRPDESASVDSAGSSPMELRIESADEKQPAAGSAQTEVDSPQASSSQNALEDSGHDRAVTNTKDVPERKVDFSPDDLNVDIEALDPTDPLVQRMKRDDSVWKNEKLAQRYERALVRLWDQLLAEGRSEQGDKFRVLQQVPFEKMTVPSQQTTESLAHGITVATWSGDPTKRSREDYMQRLREIQNEGFRIVQSEWHHAAFDPKSTSSPARSLVTMALYLEKDGGYLEKDGAQTESSKSMRLVVHGDIRVTWRDQFDADEYPVPRSIDIQRATIMQRAGPLPFREVFTVNHAKPIDRSGVQPVLVYDLNQDGRLDIALGGSNELFLNQGDFRFRRTKLCEYGEQLFETGVLADLTGDGVTDFLAPGRRGDLLLYRGDGNGTFPDPPIGKAKGGGPLQQPQAITVGDIDRDGDLDVWIAQYKISYVGGQMPSPYYDANDGFPAYLLLNDGTGKFTPSTEEAGLADKRFRRSYGSSFVDIDEDGDLDLIVVSDFAGIDIYENDGTGYFRDVTEELVDERHLFGMSITFSDFDGDGLLDFFASGMASTTARRLEYMRLGRKDRPDIHLMRSRMGYGNRMYLAKEGRLVEPHFKDQVARTGWTWGATSFDFDNDGDKDIFVANGHSSGKSTKDHCSHFWCHDIYDGTSEPNFALDAVFKNEMRGYYDRSESWDGYQKNTLLMNHGGERFSNIAFLMGVGQEFDGRAVVANDLDRDGRVDLLVVEDRWHEGQILHVFRNEMPMSGHWIGFELHDTAEGVSVNGARVKLHVGDDVSVAAIVTGDSIHAQHAPVVHFGLGPRVDVDRVEIIWPNGDTNTIDSPRIDTYHEVRYSRPSD